VGCRRQTFAQGEADIVVGAVDKPSLDNKQIYIMWGVADKPSPKDKQTLLWFR
jgi:hypothetical protein